MIFSSWQFLFVFLPIAMIGFSAIHEAWGKARKFWLTGASVVFYGYWRIDCNPLSVFSNIYLRKTKGFQTKLLKFIKHTK
jgi:alginate O-acetyltransferase complex protein AlgI